MLESMISIVDHLHERFIFHPARVWVLHSEDGSVNAVLALRQLRFAPLQPLLFQLLACSVLVHLCNVWVVVFKDGERDDVWHLLASVFSEGAVGCDC
jgi:hypothetical protein